MSKAEYIGKFKVTGKLGQGSFGIVYKGRDPNIKRDVAIKLCTVEDAGLRRRFAREAQISGNLQHKNIVTVFAADVDAEGMPFLVQEFLNGEDLREVIRRRQPIPSHQKIDYLLQVARGLAHAHAHGVIHRDIKPANVRLLDGGVVKIMDFGIAKLASAETQLTQKGVTMGTASYLPPEQVRGGDLDHRADIFSFGVLAYELLTYERPFRGNTLSALVYQILYKVPVPMSAVWPECPEVLSDLVAKCLEKKPDVRFASMEELIPELTRVAERIEAGEWPALREVSTMQLLTPQSDDTGVMSQSDVSRAARSIEEGEIPSMRVLAPSLLETQVVRPTVPAAPPPAPAESVVTQRFPAALSPAADAPTEVLPREELATRAREIGALIEKGELEAAKVHLEETMSGRQHEATVRMLEPPVPSAVAEPPGSPEPPVPLPADPPEPPAPVEPPPSRPERAAAAVPKRSTLVSQPVSEPRRDRDGSSVTSSYMMAILALPTWARWSATAVAALVLLGAVWVLLPSDSRNGAEESSTAIARDSSEPIVEPAAAPAVGFVTVNALPWARITEITDVDGYLKDLPAEPVTPLRLELPPGLYRVQLQHPDHEPLSCEVEVSEGDVTPCEAMLAEPTVTEYFKETGWWQ